METKRKLASHKKEHSPDELLASYHKPANKKGDFYCEFCGRHSTTESGNKFHERYCKQNPCGEAFVGHPVDTTTRKKISQTCSEHKKSGGYREGFGIGKSGWYKSYWCDSSWELAYVIYNLEHNISFRRNTERFPYTYKEKELYYIPDFIEGDTYIEIKGYHSEQVDAKIKYFPYSLKVLYKVEMEKYISYVEEKYGKNYIYLYETNNTN